MRTTIDINHCGVFLFWVEVCRLHHTVIKVSNAISSLDAATLKDGLYITCPGVICFQEIRMMWCLLVDIHDINDLRSCWGREPVDEEIA